MKKMLILLLTATNLVSYAEILNNPNPNILWTENGKNIKQGEGNYCGGWNNQFLTIQAITEGEDGFIFSSPDGKHHSTGHVVPVDRNYPWLVFEITAYTDNPKQYRDFYCKIHGANYFFSKVPAPGIYMQNILRGNIDEINNGQGFFSVDIFGYAIVFKYIQMVKEPANWFTVESDVFDNKKCFENGDTLVFTAKLESEAEDVTITFNDLYSSHQIRINGKDSITLKPVNKERTLWKTEVKINEISGFSSKTPSTFSWKCTILGGKLKLPMFTNNFFPYKAPVVK